MTELTVREDEVRRLAVEGLSNDEIAAPRRSSSWD